MKFDVLTLFPDLIYGYASDSILWRAQEKNLIKITAHNFREYSLDKHHKVDGRPYGGGAGMVLQIQPIYDCLKTIGALKKDKKTKVVILDPAGEKFDQKKAEEYSKLERVVLVCGRYQGFDERVYNFVDEKISVGDFVLSGGELPALTIIESTARLIPGVLGNQESLNNETFSVNVIPVQAEIEKRSSKKIDSRFHGNDKEKSENNKKGEHPLYARPEDFMGLKVPKVLLSGNHKKIEEWRNK